MKLQITQIMKEQQKISNSEYFFILRLYVYFSKAMCLLLSMCSHFSPYIENYTENNTKT